MKFPKQNIFIYGALIAFVIIFTILAFPQRSPSYMDNFYICGREAVPFRANISDCLDVQIHPGEQQVLDLLTNPLAISAYILVNPNGTATTGMSAHEIYKTMDSLKPITGIFPGVVYTHPWEEHPDVPVMSANDATYQYPVIWLIPEQNKTLIDVQGPKIVVSAKTDYDLDAVACRISILLIQDLMDC